jgi:hypothetical protein
VSDPLQPAFLITIDTEGDDVWSRPRNVTTRNGEFVERFQELCERYGQRPTWLTNHEMIHSPSFRRFAGDVIARGTGEIGMHLHAWNSPPLEALTADDLSAQPYLVEYEPRIMRAKIHALTATLEDALGVKMLSHRAGRWAFDERYAAMLLEEGYRVDCSVTPLVDWSTTPGGVAGGSDYTTFPHRAYWVSLDDVSRGGDSPLLEIPVTTVSLRSQPVWQALAIADRLPERLEKTSSLIERAANRLSPPVEWLRPTGRNGRRLRRVVSRVIREGRAYAELMLHSSELMPGGSPTFRDSQSIERLYADLEGLFASVQRTFVGATLAEFHDQVVRERDGCTPAAHDA